MVRGGFNWLEALINPKLALDGLSEYTVRQLNQERSLHLVTVGEFASALVDLTADWALVSRTGRGVPTIDLRVDYHRPAKGDLRFVIDILSAK